MVQLTTFTFAVDPHDQILTLSLFTTLMVILLFKAASTISDAVSVIWSLIRRLLGVPTR